MSETRLGEILVFIACFFGALLPVIVNPHASSLAPLWIGAFSSVLALLPITAAMFYGKKWHELRNRKGLYYSCLAGVLVGAIYYSMVYWGSYHSSPQNASIMLSFEMFAAMAFLHSRQGERLSRREAFGAALLFLAVALILVPESSHPQVGDIVLLLSTLITPIGNTFMKIARRSISSVSIMWVRSLISAVALSLIACATYEIPSASEISLSATILLVNGILIFGISKIAWIEGIHRIPVAKASSLAAITPLLTFVMTWIVLGKAPTWNQYSALPFTVFGVLLIVTKAPKKLSAPFPVL